MIYGSLQVHGLNKMGKDLARSMKGKKNIKGQVGPVITMLKREGETFEQQMRPSKEGFGVRTEVRGRGEQLAIADLNALVSDTRNWTALNATTQRLGWEFEDVTAYDKIEKVARLALQALPLYSGFDSSLMVKDSHSNPFRVVRRMRMGAATREILNLGGTIIAARSDDSVHPTNPHNPKSLLRVTNLQGKLSLSDFKLSEVGLRRRDHGNREKIKERVRQLLEKLTKKHTFVDLVPLADRLCEMGRPVEASVREKVTRDDDEAAGIVEEWVVGALVERIIIESAEKKLSNEREKKMKKWDDDEKRGAVESIHEMLDAHTQLGTYNGGGKNKIENYFMMRQLPRKSTNDAGRGGNTGGQVRKFNIEGWGKQWLTWSKENAKEATGQEAEHHWQLAEYIVEQSLERTYKRKLKEQGFWREARR